MKIPIFVSFVAFAQILYSIEANSWQELGISQVPKPPSGAIVGEITLKEHSTLTLTTSSDPTLNQQYFDGDLLAEGVDLQINLTTQGATADGYTPIYWRTEKSPPVLNAFTCGKMQGNEGACSLKFQIDSTLTPLNRMFYLDKGTLTLDQNVFLTLKPKGRVRSVFHNGGTLEFDGRFFVDLRDQEGTFTDPKITGVRKVAVEHHGVATKINTYEKDFDVQIYGDIISAGQRFELNLLTPQSIFEGHFEIGDSPIYYSQNIVRINNGASAKINLNFLQSTNPAPQRFTLSLQNGSKATIDATLDRTQYALIDFDVSHSLLYANLSYSPGSAKRGDRDNTRIALHNQGTWITTHNAFADEIFFNVLLPTQQDPVIPDQPPPNPPPPYPPELTPSGSGGNIDLRYSDFNQTLRSFDRMSEANRITLTSKLIAGHEGVFKLYGILNTALWDKDAQGNSIATDQIITNLIKGDHYIQIYWDPKTLDSSLIGVDLKKHHLIVAKQLSTETQGNFIGASTPIGIYNYTTSLIKEELKDETNNTVGYKWIIGNINGLSPDPTPSQPAKTLNGIFSIPYKNFISQISTLHQRLGDLRYLNTSFGAYLKTSYSLLHAKGTLLASQALSMHTDITLGADYGLYSYRGKTFLGAALNITPFQDFGENQSYQGNSIAYGFSLYGSTLFDNGIYTDIVIKYFFANHEYKLSSQDLLGSSINFSSQALLGSFEMGYRFRLPIETSNFDHSFYYLKPQINLVVGNIFGGKPISVAHRNHYSIHAQYASSIPIQTSLSFDLGRRFDRPSFLGDVFVTLGAEYTFNAGNPITLQTPFNQGTFKQDDIFNLKLGIGSSLILNSGMRFYFEMHSAFLGRIAPVFNLNAGIRIPIGHAKQENPSSSQPPHPPIIYGF
ncbi:autotransporter outer membrane beta-barrel domain-containing protein [Helicobacter pametensis]|uniref:autotransporter outer membrane beta-barrel domain-containing protein n=1 Tax=Helicobacter pametensis TaxID=95149 RepID=UPI000484A645|nr:autotransporter outer membrane beta-barrel domain-containing protein [Helicobacter pametensis]